MKERILFFLNVCQRVVEEEEARVPTAPHYHRLFLSLSAPAPFGKNTLLRNITFSPQGKYISWKVAGALLREKVEIHGQLPPHLHFFFPQQPFFFFLPWGWAWGRTFLKAVTTLGFSRGAFFLWSSLTFHEINLSFSGWILFYLLCFMTFYLQPWCAFLCHTISQVVDRQLWII